MNIGHAVLLAATASAAVALLATAWTVRGERVRSSSAGHPSRTVCERTRPARVGRAASWAVLVLTAAAMAHLAVLLAVSDTSVRYVWQHSASYEPLLRRLSALLAGQEGSFLVWSLAAAAAAAWCAWRWQRAAPQRRADVAIVHLCATGVTLGVLILTVASAPFRSFAAAFPDLGATSAPLDGRGLNPVLANPWMPPHTLLTFAAYAFVGLTFGFAILELLRVAQGRPGDARRWRPAAVRITRWAWVLLTGSLLTGLVWAYEEMSFGWFWSWDPVEAATLSVWLVLTAALHARGEAGSGRRQLVHAPLLGGLAFVGVVFASFVTRSGLHPSVHAFASGSTGRFLGIALAISGLGLAALTVAATRKLPTSPPRRPWLFWAAWLLVSAAGLISWGLTYPILAGPLGRAAELDTGFFTLWGYLVAIALLLLLGFGLQRSGGWRREAVLTLSVFVALTVVVAFIAPVPELELIGAERRSTVGSIEAFLGRASLLTLLPPAVYAVLAVAERWWSSCATARSGRRRVVETGGAMVHLGVVFAIAGVVFATVLSSTVTVHVDPGTQVGVADDGLEVHLVALERSETTDAVGTVVEQRETVAVEVHTARGRVAAGLVALSTYPERDDGRHPRVLIHRTALADTQVIYHGAAEQTVAGVPVTVRTIPLINLAWAGVLLLLVGMALFAGGHLRHRQGAPSHAARPDQGLATASKAHQ